MTTLDTRIIEEKKLAIAAAEAAFKADVANGQINMLRINDIRETRANWSLNQRIKEICETGNFIPREKFRTFCSEYMKAFMFKYSGLRKAHFTNLYQLHGQSF